MRVPKLRVYGVPHGNRSAELTPRTMMQVERDVWVQKSNYQQMGYIMISGDVLSRFRLFPTLLIMYLLSSSVAAACLLCSQVSAVSIDLGARDLDSFVSSERANALQGALNNIGPDGAAVPGAGAGLVVASPSMADPNCQFASFSTTYTGLRCRAFIDSF